MPRGKLYNFEKKRALDRRKQRRLEQDVDDFKIFSEVFDTSTLMSIYHLLNTRRLQAVHGCIRMGKEACIHLAESKDGVVILKIYRIATSDFRSMWQYLQGDARFRQLGKNRRDVITTWVSREYRNLAIAQKSGCSSPIPITIRKNIIVMQCVKRDDRPAPRLVDVSCEEPGSVLNSIVSSYVKLYQEGGLVHGDLSPYNVLMGDEGPVLIDFSQGTVKEGPKATNLLFRDVETLTSFFAKLGVSVETRELVEKISGEEGISPDETVVI